MAFAIRLVSRPRNAWRWVGRAELAVESGQLRLRGLRHRWFLPGKQLLKHGDARAEKLRTLLGALK